MRIKKEFYCNECQKYFDVKLNMALNGNHRVHCPNCGHIHYREIKDGVITGVRFDTNPHNILVDDIFPMRASCRDYQTETKEENLLTAKGIITQSWKDRFSKRI